MLFESGPYGWSCVSANWRNKAQDRRQVRHLLRVLTQQLDNRKAISQLCFADQPRNETDEISPDEGCECL